MKLTEYEKEQIELIIERGLYRALDTFDSRTSCGPVRDAKVESWEEVREETLGAFRRLVG